MEQTEKQAPEEQRAEIVAKSKEKDPEAPESFHRILADKYLQGAAAARG